MKLFCMTKNNFQIYFYSAHIWLSKFQGIFARLVVHSIQCTSMTIFVTKLTMSDGHCILPRFQEYQSTNIYRASQVVVHLGWVDLDLGCSTTLPGQ